MTTKEKIDIRLTDCDARTKEFSIELRGEKVISKPVHTERGFGQTHTDSAEIDGCEISGDLWRFFEGSLGVENLLKQIKVESGDSRAVIESFKSVFSRTADDDAALRAWEKYVAEKNSGKVDEDLANLMKILNPKKMKMPKP